MPHFVGLDVSLKTTSICVVDAKGAVVERAVVETDPKVIATALRGQRRRYGVVLLESGAIAGWLCAALVRRGLPAVCAHAFHAHRMLSTRLNKTDANDAEGLAQLGRTGAFKPVHVKSVEAATMKSLLKARSALLSKRVDLEQQIRGLLRGFGLKVERTTPKTFARRVSGLVRRAPPLIEIAEPLLEAHRHIQAQFEKLDALALAKAEEDPVCALLMTAPGVGPMTALVFRSAIDDPARFKRSRSVGAHLGLTRRLKASGDSDPNTRISKRGDVEVRKALFWVGQAVLHPHTRPSPLKTWAEGVAARRGRLKAVIAVARRMAVILLVMWKEGREFRMDPSPSGG